MLAQTPAHERGAARDEAVLALRVDERDDLLEHARRREYAARVRVGDEREAWWLVVVVTVVLVLLVVSVVVVVLLVKVLVV